MKVIQLLPTISYGDAVGNDTLAIRDILREMGYETGIYAENIDPRLPAGTAVRFEKFPDLADDDVIIYHGSTGTDLNYKLPMLGGRKMMIYHNITPPAFFRPYAPDAERRTEDGLAGIARLADKLEYCIVVSEFNKRDLLRMGYTCPIDVCPVLIPFSDYEKAPSREVMRKYERDGYTNIVFVGRIAPNKKQEDVIRAFYVYHKYFNEKSRLVLVGDWSGMEKYHDRLCDYTARLGLTEDVQFTGHIKFNEILAWYRLADVFLCMSEHEGFCVPLAEAMYFDVPIAAYAAAAVPDTLGGSGVLLDTKDPKTAAEAIHKLISDGEYRETVLQGQRERLKSFSYDNVSGILKKQLLGFIKGAVRV